MLATYGLSSLCQVSLSAAILVKKQPTSCSSPTDVFISDQVGGTTRPADSRVPGFLEPIHVRSSRGTGPYHRQALLTERSESLAWKGKVCCGGGRHRT